MANADLDIVIQAHDEYSAAFNRFKATAAGATASAAASAAGSAQSMDKSWGGALGNMQTAWLKLGAVIAASAWFVAAGEKALEAEVAYNKLRIQVEALGLSYESQRERIEGAINAASKYAIVQDEDVAAVLQQLILHSGNYAGSLSNLNLVYDLAYLKSIAAADAAEIVGKAMGGNTEGLSRLFPELKNVNDLLGENATRSEKAAFNLQFLNEKVAGANSQMVETEVAVKRANAAYEMLHQVVGGLVNAVVVDLFGKLRDTVDALSDLKTSITDVYDAINGDTIAAKQNANAYKEGNDAIMESVFARGKSLAVIAKETKAKSDLRIAEEKAAAKAKKDLESAAKREADNQVASATRIIEVEMATEKLTASKERLLQLDIIAFASQGATTAQLLQYVEVLKKKQQVEAEMADKETRMAAAVAFAELTQSETAMLQSEYDKRQAALVAHNAQMLIEKQKSGATDEETEALHLSMIAQMQAFSLQVNEEYAELSVSINGKMYRMMTTAQAQAFGQMAANLNYLYTESGSKYRLLFEMAKAFAISQTIINTYKDAIAGAAALSGIPVIGPALAMAYKATAIATGLMAVSKIASTQPGSTAGGNLGSSGFSGGGYNGAAAPESLSRKSEEKPTQNITIIINNPLSEQNWEKITQDNIVPAINAAGERNVKISLRAVEAN